MLPLDLLVNPAQPLDQLLLLPVFPEHGRHVFPQAADYVGVDLRKEDNLL